MEYTSKKTEKQLLAELKALKEKVKDLERNKGFSEIIAENTSDNIAITTFDLKAEYIYVSPSVKQILGYDPEELVGRSFFDFIHPDDKKIIFPLLKKYISKKIKKILQIDNPDPIEKIEFRFRDKAGNWRYSQSTINFVGSNLLSVTRDITEQKKAEHDLKTSKDRLSKTLIAANDGIWDWDLITNKVYFDPRYYEMAGYEVNEFPHELHEFQKRIHPDDIDNVFAQVQKHIGGDTARYKVEFRFKKKNNDWLWIMGRGVIVERDTNNKPTRFIGTHSDITEQKLVEKALKDSEERLKILFESAPDAYYINDLKGNFIDGNKAAEELLGYKKEELIGKSFLKLKLLSASEILKVSKLLLKNLKGKATGPDEFILKRKDGNKVSVEIRTYPVKIDNSTVILGIAHDITERKKVEEALRESEKKFTVLYNSSPDMFVSVSPDDASILLCNDTLLNKTGYSRKEVIGSSIFMLYHTDCMSEVEEAFQQFVKTGTVEDKELILVKKDGSKIDVSLNVDAVRDKKGNILYSISSWRDITDRKKSELLLQESKDELQIINTKLEELVEQEVAKSREKDRMMIVQSKQAAMGEMIGNIAHQWRQPLNDIGLYIQNLQDSWEFDELTEEKLAGVVKSTIEKLTYMSQTIDDFRNFFRSDKEKISFSLSDNIRKTIMLTEASFKANSIDIEMKLSEDVMFTGYPNEFSQALLNILNNAKDVLIEKKMKNPKVHISLLKSGKRTVLTISNNGDSIPQDIIDKIFDPYFTTKIKSTGTGLGLYISKTIIERNMLGKLTVRSIKNHTEFKIELVNEMNDTMR